MPPPAVRITMKNQKDYERNIRELAIRTGVSVKSVIERQTAITAGQLAKRFPPNKLSTGKQAIYNDLNRVIVPMTEMPALKDLEEKYPNDERFDVQGIMIQKWHEENRSQRTGRIKTTVTTKKGWYNGKHRIPERLHVPESKLKSYVNRRAKSVGKLKAGWLWAVDSFPGARKPANWITRHSNHGTGRNMMRDNGSGYIEFTNPYPYASRWRRVNDHVIASRRRGVVKEVRAALRAEIRKFNQARAS